MFHDHETHIRRLCAQIGSGCVTLTTAEEELAVRTPRPLCAFLPRSAGEGVSRSHSTAWLSSSHRYFAFFTFRLERLPGNARGFLDGVTCASGAGNKQKQAQRFQIVPWGLLLLKSALLCNDIPRIFNSPADVEIIYACSISQ